MTSYHLHDNNKSIIRGPLALVAAQAHQSAATGVCLLISDNAGNTVLIEAHRGTISATWKEPAAQLQLFAETNTTRHPDWFQRLRLLIVELNNDDQNNRLPHHDSTKQRAPL